MKVALISRAVWGLHGYGGLERQAIELAAFLARAGSEVTVITMPPTRNPEWNIPEVNLQVVHSPRLPLRGVADRVINYSYWSHSVAGYLAEHSFDLVHAQGMSGWGYSDLLVRGEARGPLVISPRSMEEFKTSPTKRLAYLPFHLFARQAARRASALIAADSSAVADIPRFLKVPPERVVMIPNGIDVAAAVACVTPEATKAVSARYGLQQRAPILLSVARLEADKGLYVMLDALSRIRPSLPSKWLWLVVGEGPDRLRLESKIQALKLAAHIDLIGSVDESTLQNLYDLATLFVHPTRFEGSSLAVLEAMAHARPIVATSVGGIPDKVLRGQNGYLVEPGNSFELGDKILYALRDTRRLREMGDASYEIARQTFDWNTVIHQTLALYEELTTRPIENHNFLSLDADAPM